MSVGVAEESEVRWSCATNGVVTTASHPLQVNALIELRPSHAKQRCGRASGSSETRCPTPRPDVPTVGCPIAPRGAASECQSLCAAPVALFSQRIVLGDSGPASHVTGPQGLRPSPVPGTLLSRHSGRRSAPSKCATVLCSKSAKGWAETPISAHVCCLLPQARTRCGALDRELGMLRTSEARIRAQQLLRWRRRSRSTHGPSTCSIRTRRVHVTFCCIQTLRMFLGWATLSCS